MKLSEMSTKDAAACMAELAVPIGNLIKNKDVKKYLKLYADSEMTLDTFGDMLINMLPVLLRDQFEDTSRVLSVLTGKTSEEIGKQSFKVTVSDIQCSLDKEFIGFFTK